MVKKNTLPFVFENQLPTRFGVLRRYAKNEDAIRWFEVPAVMMFHVANAWQEGNTIKLYSCCFDQVCPLRHCETTAKMLLTAKYFFIAHDQLICGRARGHACLASHATVLQNCVLLKFAFRKISELTALHALPYIGGLLIRLKYTTYFLVL